MRSHFHDPRPHDERNHGHRERAALRYATSSGVRLPAASDDAIVYLKVVDVSFVRKDDPCRHSGSPAGLKNEVPAYMIEDFRDVRYPPTNCFPSS